MVVVVVEDVVVTKIPRRGDSCSSKYCKVFV